MCANKQQKIKKMTNLALTERRNPDTINIDLMDSYQIAQAINNEDKKVAALKAKENKAKK